MTKQKLLLLAVASSLVMAISSPGYAFPWPKGFHWPASGDATTNPPNRAGAEGIYGTGGKQDYGIKCSHCHIDGAGRIGMRIDVNGGWDTAGGLDAYVPGKRYSITVVMENEHLTMPGNVNGMSATFEDQNGRLAGVLVTDSGARSDNCPANSPDTLPSGQTTTVSGTCHATLFSGAEELDTWSFDWIAPSAGTGDVTLFVAIVDGDTADTSSLDDDTVEKSFVLVEGNPANQ